MFRLPLPTLSAACLAAPIGATLLLGCSSGGDEEPLPSCISLDPDCSLLYQPVFTEIHRRTLAPTCSEEGTACHAGTGARGGLVLEDIDQAFSELLDPDDPRVVPGDPECSLLMVRLEHPGRSVMPPGQALTEAERCTIAAWIRNGAER